VALALIPDAVFDYYGVTFRPSKYWCLAIPTWLGLTVLMVFLVIEAYNMMLVPPRRDIRNIYDSGHPNLQGDLNPISFARVVKSLNRGILWPEWQPKTKPSPAISATTARGAPKKNFVAAGPVDVDPIVASRRLYASGRRVPGDS